MLTEMQLQNASCKILDGDALKGEHKKGVARPCSRKDSCKTPPEKSSMATPFKESTRKAVLDDA